MRAAVEDVGDQHGVVPRRDRQADIGPTQHMGVVFQVVPDLQHRRVDQHRPEDAADLGQRDLLQRRAAEVQPVAVRRHMGDRDVAGAARRRGQGDAAQHRRLGVQRVGLGVDRQHPGLDRRIGPALQRRRILHQLVVLGDRLGLARRGQVRLVATGGAQLVEGGLDPGDGRPELHLLQEPHQLRPVRRPGHDALQPDRHRRVAAQRHQLAADPRLLGVLDQGFAPLRLLDLAGPRPAGCPGRHIR